MMNGKFQKTESRSFNLFDEFETNRGACLAKHDVPKDAAADEPEVAINIPDGGFEKNPGKFPVKFSEEDTVKSVLAGPLVAINDIRSLGPPGPEIPKFGNIILTIPVRIKNPVLRRVAESGAECPAITLIFLVKNEA